MSTSSETGTEGLAVEKPIWCRCGDPLPPKTEPFGREWTCSACGGQRRYHEKLVVQNGGIVGQCGECAYALRKRGKRAPLTSVRAVTCTTQLAGEIRERHTYYLCDPCIDAEIARQKSADVLDGRRASA